MHSPSYINKRFLTPMILFGLVEVADAPEFMLVIIGKILAVEIYYD